MKVLLDTNIIIHREANRVINHDIGQLFKWIDKLHYEKYIHPITIEEIKNYKDSKTVDTFSVKLESYNLIKHPLPFNELILDISKQIDVNENDINDTRLLNEIYQNSIDILITEDKKIHRKASMLNISDKVFKTQSFLEKVTSENPDLVNYTVLSVKQADFGELTIEDSFFDSFREDYSRFNRWYNKKRNEICYVCNNDNKLTAFLYIKIENYGQEDYSDISPVFKKKKRLKIGTLKVISNGYKIGERFLKIIFDNALENNVEEIYVTIFDKRNEQIELIEMLKHWGFIEHGTKTTEDGVEVVLTRQFGKFLPVNITNPKLTFPFISRDTRKYIIPINPEYHTELFPDSINTREDKSKYMDNQPHRNRIGKVYISHSKDNHLKTGDVIVIYKKGETTPKRFSSTVTSICIVEDIITDFNGFDDFYQTCVRRTVINRDELLKKWWNKFPSYKPFVIKFLFAHSFPTPKPTLDDLYNLGVIKKMSQGFIEINNKQFTDLLNFVYRKKTNN